MSADPYIVEHSQTYTDFGLQQSKLWPPNTLCVTIAGANTAKTAILKFAACFPDSIVGFIPETTKADLHFVKYSLDLMRNRFLTVTRGATQDNLSLDKLLSFPIPTPPLSVQRQVAGILSAYDDLIENCQRRIRVLDDMVRALYREWFVLFRYPGHEKVPLVDSALGRIPKGWEVMPVADVFETLGGGTPSRKDSAYWTDGTIQWFAPSDLTAAKTMFMEYSSERITERGLAESSAKLFKPWSVMMTSRATIGAIAINTQVACTNQGFITCLPSPRMPIYLLFHWLRENVPLFERLATGATFREISRGVFRKIALAVSPPGLSAQFEDAVRPFSEAILNLQRRAGLLRSARGLLLPWLLSGQVALKDAG